MTTLLDTYDSLQGTDKWAVEEMIAAARDALMARGVKPLNDDRAAAFDEACAVYYVQYKEHTPHYY